MSALGHKQTWRRPTTVVGAAIDHDVLALNLLCSKPTNKSTMRAASISRPMADMMRSSKEINESGCSCSNPRLRGAAVTTQLQGYLCGREE